MNIDTKSVSVGQSFVEGVRLPKPSSEFEKQDRAIKAINEAKPETNNSKQQNQPPARRSVNDAV